MTVNITLRMVSAYTPGSQQALTISDEGTIAGSNPAVINFVGPGVTTTYAGNTATVTIPGGSAGGQSAIQFQDEGANVGTSGAVTSINFVGAGVAASAVGNALTVTVSAGGTATWGGISGTLSSQTDLQSALTARASLSGATFTGGVITPASTASTAGLNLPHGTAPTTPTNGDIWSTSAGWFVRTNGATQQISVSGHTHNAGTELTGTLASAQFPAQTGDVTNTAGSLATTISANAVTNAKSAQMAANTIKGNNTGATANPADLTVAQLNAMINSTVAPVWTNITSKPTTVSGYSITDAETTFTATLTVTAAGSTQGTATAITKTSDFQLIEVTTVPANSGVILPASSANARFIVVNRGANALQVYPATGGAIDGGAANASVIVAIGQEMAFFGASATQWYSDNIANGQLSNAKLANMAANTIKGTIAGGAPTDLTVTQATSMLNTFVPSGAGALKGLVPAPSTTAGTTNFLREDGTWAVPAGGGGAITAKDEGVNLTTALTSLDFVGAGVTATNTGGAVTVTIGGGSTTPGGTNGQIQYNNAGAFGGFTMGGDATIVASTGALTIANSAVTNAKQANMANATIKARITAGAGAPEDATATQVTALLDVATTSLKGVMSAADKTKLDGVATGATANSSDATLLARANHTGSQLASTISDFAATVIATVLTGFTVAGTRTAIVATDTILAAFGKVQKYFNDLAAIAFSGSAADLSAGTIPVARLPAATGDVTTTAGTYAFTIPGQTVTYAKMQNVSATSRIMGRATAGAGSMEELNNTQVKTILAIANTDVSGLGALATLASVDLSGSQATGIMAAARMPALTGDVTTTAGAVATTIASGVVTNAKMANVATATFKGRVTAATGAPEDLTGTQATTLLDTFTSALKGLAPASGGGTTNFLRADGTWAAPAGGGGGAWGSITGTLSSQTDLNNALSAKEDTFTVTTGVTAAGSGSQAAATAITRTSDFQVIEVTTVAANSGVRLPTATANMRFLVVNRGVNVLQVYPETGGTIDGGAANASSFVAIGQALLYVAVNSTTWYTDNIANGQLANAKMATMPTLTIKGNNTAGNASPIDLTATEVTAMLNLFTAGLKGLVPSGGTASTFLRGDGTWVTPAGGGSTDLGLVTAVSTSSFLGGF